MPHIEDPGILETIPVRGRKGGNKLVALRFIFDVLYLHAITNNASKITSFQKIKLSPFPKVLALGSPKTTSPSRQSAWISDPLTYQSSIQ